nr:Tn3 family transposase [Streptosporangium roseum]
MLARPGSRATSSYAPRSGHEPGRAYDLIRMMMAEGRITSLGRAFAHYGRIFKSMHLLHVAHLEDYRRMDTPR